MTLWTSTSTDAPWATDLTDEQIVDEFFHWVFNPRKRHESVGERVRGMRNRLRALLNDGLAARAA